MAATGQVKVVCRVRPQNAMERKRSGAVCVQCRGDTLHVRDTTFTFDRVLDPSASQEACFQCTAAPLVRDVVQGYNATIFAYGQTSSGKTYTMEGEGGDQAGVIPRSIAALCAHRIDGVTITTKVSYLEIYMERIRDLLDDLHTRTNLDVREDPERGIYVAGITEAYCESEEELLRTLHRGAANRATAATGMNQGSSRSHAVFLITVIMREIDTGSETVGKLYLVDLAGSEMIRKTHATGQQLQEAKTINKSLSTLGSVIKALTAKKDTHVPYRDSKLTRMLQNALGGNSKTCLVINCSPSTYNEHETLSTLRFGARAKLVRNTPTINARKSVTELTRLLQRTEHVIEVQTSYISALESQLQQYHAQGLRPLRNSDEAHYLARIAQLTSELTDEQQESQRRLEEIQALRRLLNPACT